MKNHQLGKYVTPITNCFLGAHLVASKLRLARGNGWNHLMRSTFWRIDRPCGHWGSSKRTPTCPWNILPPLFQKEIRSYLYFGVPWEYVPRVCWNFLRMVSLFLPKQSGRHLFFRPWVGMWSCYAIVAVCSWQTLGLLMIILAKTNHWLILSGK